MPLEDEAVDDQEGMSDGTHYEEDEVVDERFEEEVAEEIAREAEEDVRRPRGLGRVSGPTPREREDHELTHAQYRPWCDDCVAGRVEATQDAHPVSFPRLPLPVFDFLLAEVSFGQGLSFFSALFLARSAHGILQLLLEELLFVFF